MKITHNFQVKIDNMFRSKEVLLNFQVKINNMFRSKEVLLNVMRAIAIRDNFQFQTIKSNKQVLVLSCLVDGWSLRACLIGDDGNFTWIIRRFDHDHSCSLDIVFSGHK